MDGLLQPIITALPFYRIPEAYNGATSDQTPFYFQKYQCKNDCHYGTITDKNHLPSFIIKIPKSYGVGVGTSFDFQLMCADGTNVFDIVPVAINIIAIITPAQKITIEASPPAVNDSYLVDIGGGTYQYILWNGAAWNEDPIAELVGGEMYNVSSDGITYIVINGQFVETNNGIQLCDIGDYTYFICNGIEVEDLPCGLRQINILFDIVPPAGLSKRFMSELIDVREFNVLDNLYHKLEVSNSCALGNIPFENILFTQAYYFDEETGVGEPESSVNESKEEDGLGNEKLVFSRITKLFILDTDYVPEYIVDFFFFTTQNDDVHITYPFEETNSQTITSQYKGRREINSDTMEVAGDWNNIGCYNQVRLKFGLLDDMIKTACCQQLDKDGCIISSYDIISFEDESQQAAIEGAIPNNGDCYIITGAPGVGGWKEHINEIACWNGVDWDYIVPENDLLITNLDDAKLYIYITGENWKEFVSIELGAIGVNTIAIKGFTPSESNSFVYYKNTIAMFWTPAFNKTAAELLSGVTITGLAPCTDYDIKLVTKSNNCDYGESDEVQATTLADETC